MKEFDERWRRAAARARAAAPRDAAMPAGFADALWPLHAAPVVEECVEASAEQIWLSFSARSLVAVAAILLVSLAVDHFRAARAPASFVPSMMPREAVGFWSP